MFTDFIEKYPEYRLINKPSLDFIEKYKKKLPEGLIEFWSLYGFGEFMNGYLKIINPDEYQNILNEGYDNRENEIVFGITALGDFLTWTGDSIRIVRFRYSDYDIINSGNIQRFFNRRLCDESFLEIEFRNLVFDEAQKKLGKLELDECYGYQPLLGLGGSEKVENLQKVKIKEYISITTQALGKIQ